MRSIHKIVSGAMLLAGGVLGSLGQLVTSEPAANPPTTPPSIEVTAVPVPRDPAPSGGVMPQKDFPCQEDEALLYHPKFGPDMVGCMNLDEVRATTW